jgi:hypothetical protein
MDVRRDARSASIDERTTDMSELRRCIGSKTFGIEAHDAPVADFPVQPSQKDGLGRMCKTHWNQYTTALRKAALARKAAEAKTAPTPEVAESKPAASAIKGRPSKPKAAKPKASTAVEDAADAAPAAEA